MSCRNSTVGDVMTFLPALPGLYDPAQGRDSHGIALAVDDHGRAQEDGTDMNEAIMAAARG